MIIERDISKEGVVIDVVDCDRDSLEDLIFVVVDDVKGLKEIKEQ